MRDPDLSNIHWQRFRARIIATSPPICALCGQPIDKTLPGTHRDGPTIDHKTPRSRGGAVYDPANCQLTHQRCNAAKRNDIQPITTTRDW